jgi:hypothetical protein
VAVDKEGGVYVTGDSTGLGSRADYVTLKYDEAGLLLWEAWFNGPGNENDQAFDLVVDEKGAVYVTGHSSSGSVGYSDYTTAKYDRNGNVLWVARYNGPGSATDIALAMAVDEKDNVYVTGLSLGSDSAYDYATIKYRQSKAGEIEPP